MTPPILTFFNNKGGVGKTTLVYHIAWAFSLLEKRVVIVDVDPQANLTAAFLEEDEIERLWTGNNVGSTIYQCVKPLTGVGDIAQPHLQRISPYLFLVSGDASLSGFEETLSNEWPISLGTNNLYRPMRILSSFWQVMMLAAEQIQADVIIADIGPNLGAINRSVLIATDYVAIPLGADLFSLQGLKNLGPTLSNWKKNWAKRLDNWKDSQEACEYPTFMLPRSAMQPIGYLCQQYGVRLNRPVIAYDQWVNRIPGEYRRSVLNEQDTQDTIPNNDPHCLATIKHYRSLIPMAQEHRKPIFQLTSADGAIGGHASAVQLAEKDFISLAKTIASKININV
jgi:cellulose biosynthesis protein BcsQ